MHGRTEHGAERPRSCPVAFVLVIWWPPTQHNNNRYRCFDSRLLNRRLHALIGSFGGARHSSSRDPKPSVVIRSTSTALFKNNESKNYNIIDRQRIEFRAVVVVHSWNKSDRIRGPEFGVAHKTLVGAGLKSILLPLSR